MTDSRHEVAPFDAQPVVHHHLHVSGIRYHYGEAGAGPLVVLVHGFPELWYSYRHQISALAAAGYHAVAVDLRGFGDSEVSARVEDYSLLHNWGAVGGVCRGFTYYDNFRGGNELLEAHGHGSIPAFPCQRPLLVLAAR